MLSPISLAYLTAILSLHCFESMDWQGSVPKASTPFVFTANNMSGTTWLKIL